jgi:hypothetical protein
MYRFTLPLLILVLLSTAAVAAEFADYPQFRYSSGLPGGTFGVDPDGHAGFEGAMQINIPVGYTPGAGNWAFVPSAAALNGGFPNDYDGIDVNGTFAWGLGFGGADHALWLADMNTGNGKSGESAYNVQFQLARQNEKRPGISVGVVDITNLRPKETARPFGADAISYFVAATWEAGTQEKPVYYTLGSGTGRFSPFFAGVSYQPSERVKMMAEYDSFNPNIGIAYKLYQFDQRWQTTIGLSLIDLERVNIGVSLTRSSH